MTTTWWNRLTAGLKRSSTEVGSKLRALLLNRKIDQHTLDDLEELLISSDMGVATAAKLRGQLAALKLPPATSADTVIEHLATFIEGYLRPVALPLTCAEQELTVVLMIGVNGSGKTTTISKFARLFAEQGKKVELAACDTFRAAATEQLAVWADRLKVPLYRAQQGHDASGLAFEAVQGAIKNRADVLLVDTAGRLQNKEHLMGELEKIQRVIKKVVPTAPHHVLLVLDATTGQNAINQVEVFKKAANVTGIVVTKLDGTAKGGIIVSLADAYGLPIHAIGVGESYDDLQAFSAEQFARTLVGMEESNT